MSHGKVRTSLSVGMKRQTKGVLKISCRLVQSFGLKLKADDDLNLALAHEWHRLAFFTQYKKDKLLRWKRIHLIPSASLLFPIILVQGYVMLLSIFCLNITLKCSRQYSCFLKKKKKGKEKKKTPMKERTLFPHSIKVARIDFRNSTPKKT